MNGALLWGHALRRVARFGAKSNVSVTIGKPSALAERILATVRADRVVYDAMDDFPAFYHGRSRSALEKRERRIARRADVVYVCSTNSVARMTAMGVHAQIVTNGCRTRALPEPDRGRFASRALGYVGTIGTWFDWDLVADVARARPDLTLEITGPVFTSPRRTLPTNVRLLGACRHEEAIRRMQGLRVGIIPFRADRVTWSADPLKYYEYRALGLPVVSSPVGQMQQHPGRDRGVFLASGRDEWLIGLEAALAYRDTLDGVARFRALNDWNVRFIAAGVFDGGSGPPPRSL